MQNTQIFRSMFKMLKMDGLIDDVQKDLVPIFKEHLDKHHKLDAEQKKALHDKIVAFGRIEQGTNQWRIAGVKDAEIKYESASQHFEKLLENERKLTDPEIAKARKDIADFTKEHFGKLQQEMKKMKDEIVKIRTQNKATKQYPATAEYEQAFKSKLEPIRDSIKTLLDQYLPALGQKVFGTGK